MLVIGVTKDLPPRLQTVVLEDKIANQATSVRQVLRRQFHVHLEPIIQERRAQALPLACNVLKAPTVRTMPVPPIRLVLMDSIARLV
jgi:hypothetical protein